MNAFDAGILHWANSFAHRWPAFDKAMGFVSGNDLLKGQLFMIPVWWLWFRSGERRRETREILVATVAAAFAAVAAGRALALGLPFRVRPMFNPELGFVMPYDLGYEAKMRSWSAFPSDHAMMFAAIATGFLLISRRWGVAAYLYMLAMIVVPRVYLGLHHPTDVLAGLVLGVAAALAFNSEKVRRPLADRVLALERAYEGPFYAAFFFVTLQIGTMFADARYILSLLVRAVRG